MIQDHAVEAGRKIDRLLAQFKPKDGEPCMEMGLSMYFFEDESTGER